MGYFDNNDIVRYTHDSNHDGRLSPTEDLAAGVRWSEIEEEANAYAEKTGGGIGYSGRSGFSCTRLIVTIFAVSMVLGFSIELVYDYGWILGTILSIFVALIVFAIYYVSYMRN